MDRSRSPRNLSDEARLLQRLEEVELPPGATDAERAAARAEAAAEVAAEVAGAVIRPRDRVIFRSPIGPAPCRN